MFAFGVTAPRKSQRGRGMPMGVTPQEAVVHPQRHLLQAVLSYFFQSKSEHLGLTFEATLSSPHMTKSSSSVQATRKALHRNPESIM